MSQPKYRGFASGGAISILDPDFECLSLVKALNPDFKISSDPPPPVYVPALARIGRRQVPGISLDDLTTMSDQALWDLHHAVLRVRNWAGSGQVALLDIKTELASRLMCDCRLCGCGCRVDRYQSTGRCQLGDEAFYDCVYTHVAEEAPVTPCLVVKLVGCALRCQGCQAFDVLSASPSAKKMTPAIWEEIPRTAGFDSAITLQFVGGNPDEALYSILDTLCYYPSTIQLPIVWNNHGYAAREVINLLDGVVDVYLTDFKFGPGDCCERTAGINRYWDYATCGIKQAAAQDARIIIRILVLPGHLSCCCEPALSWLAKYRDRIWVSFVSFIPMWKAVNDSVIGRPTSESEMRSIKTFARNLGVRDIKDSERRFWVEQYGNM